MNRCSTNYNFPSFSFVFFHGNISWKPNTSRPHCLRHTLQPTKFCSMPAHVSNPSNKSTPTSLSPARIAAEPSSPSSSPWLAPLVPSSTLVSSSSPLLIPILSSLMLSLKPPPSLASLAMLSSSIAAWWQTLYHSRITRSQQ